MGDREPVEPTLSSFSRQSCVTIITDIKEIYGQYMHSLPSQVSNMIERGDNILLQSTSFEVDDSKACTDLLTLEAPAHENVLCISFTKSLDDYRAAWDQHVNSAPGSAAFLDVTAETRSTATVTNTANEPTETTSFDPTVAQITTPSDLTTLGVRITERLNEWDAENSDRQTVVCFESISTLLQYTELEQTFKFLHVLTDHFTSADAIAHYHLDPTVHDEKTMSMLTQVFDAVCAFEDGEWTVQTR
jgi:hypothetical protein